MAGDWNPVRVDLPRCREVVALARLTGRSRHEVVGLLVDLWGWASNETVDGLLARLAVTDLCDMIGADPAFWQAVADVGWLEITSAGVKVPNFSKWLGKGAKARLQKKRRQEDWRTKDQGRVDVDARVSTQAPHSGGARASTEAPRTGDARASTKAPHTGDARAPTTGQDSTEENRTEEDRTEHHKNTPIAPKGAIAEAFEHWWALYPRKSGKRRARRNFDKAIRSLKTGPPKRTTAESADILLVAVRAYASSPKAQSEWCWDPATWLSGGHWEDDPAVWQRGDRPTETKGPLLWGDD